MFNIIKKNDYVRIKYHGKLTKIAQVKEVCDKDKLYKNMKAYKIDLFLKIKYNSIVSNIIHKDDIIEHDSNKLKILKVGDYINER